MPRVPDSHFDARRRQILEAAYACFARQGFHATSMQEIADEAGLSAGALYRYFDGKEALIEGLAGWGREQKRMVLEGLTAGGGAGGLARSVGAMLRFLAGEAAAAAVRLDIRLWGEALDHPAVREVVAAELTALREPIAAHLRRERRSGRVRREVDPDAAARAVVSLLAGAELQAAFEPGWPAERYADAVADLVEGLGTRTPTTST